MNAVIVDNISKKLGNSEMRFWLRIVDLFKPVKENGTSTLAEGAGQTLRTDNKEAGTNHELTRQGEHNGNGTPSKKLSSRLINRIFAEASLIKNISLMEKLMHGVRLYGREGKDVRKQMVENLLRPGLEKRAIDHFIKAMLRGMLQKVAIACALLTKSSDLLVDEPTTGLVPRSKRVTQKVIRSLREQFGVTINLTAHDLLEAHALCDRIAIMDRGKVVAVDTPQGLKIKIPPENGIATSVDDVLLKLTGNQLVDKNGDTE